MANVALSGACFAEVDHVHVITIQRVNVDESIPSTAKKGNYGPIGIAQGIADVTGSFVLTVPTTGMEIDLEAYKDRSFTLTWSRGAQRFSAVGCRINRIGDADDPGTGNYDVTVSFLATEILQVG